MEELEKLKGILLKKGQKTKVLDYEKCNALEVRKVKEIADNESV